jgi:uncharacterized protein (TIGR02996 family)
MNGTLLVGRVPFISLPETETTMTTEEDFQRALDANPDAHHTRLVFADWLEERGDPRADGYRALGRMQRVPSTRRYYGTGWGYSRSKNWYTSLVAGSLPEDWWSLAYAPYSSSYPTRREAENAAAAAFERLTPERRTVILTTELARRQRPKGRVQPPMVPRRPQTAARAPVPARPPRHTPTGQEHTCPAPNIFWSS